MSGETRKIVIEQLDKTIKHVARIRKGAILLEGMEPEEVDKLINEMCEKHYKTFDNMNKVDLIMESLMEAMEHSPEHVRDVLGGGEIAWRCMQSEERDLFYILKTA